jgi:ribulose-5-phosphate 4-epimerase/fuculose-1-phosphate aldolase
VFYLRDGYRTGFDPKAVAIERRPYRQAKLQKDRQTMTASDTTTALDLAKIQLAAAHRLASLHELDEGIDNHFTVTVPGEQDQYLILPFGRHWSEARASDMMTFNEAGQTLSGSGPVELSAQCIHAPIHRMAGSRVVMHTHQTWATALNMLQDNHLFPLSQTAAFFDGHIAYDDTYTGLADTLEEGERLAKLLGKNHIILMKNHGALVVGDTVAQAYRRLYRLERVCRMQLIAMAAAGGSGGKLAVLGSEVVARVQAINPQDSHSRADRERLFFEAMMRVLDRDFPGYRD